MKVFPAFLLAAAYAMPAQGVTAQNCSDRPKENIQKKIKEFEGKLKRAGLETEEKSGYERKLREAKVILEECAPFWGKEEVKK